MAQSHYGDEEARRALADVNHTDPFAASTKGEGLLGDDKDMRFDSPSRLFGEPPIEVHHQRKTPLAAGKPSPVVSAGYEPFNEAEPEDVGDIFPPTSGYGNKQDDMARAVRSSGYGEQPDRLTKLKDCKGYTSLGIQESLESENSVGGRSEEGSDGVKEWEGPARYKSMAREVEDSLEYSSGGNTDDVLRARAVASEEFLRNEEQQQGDKVDDSEESFGNVLRLEEGEREGRPKEKPVEIVGVAPRQAAMAEEPESGGSAIGSTGIIDLQSLLKGDYVDTSETSSQEPTVIDDSMEGDKKDELQADDPILADEPTPQQSAMAVKPFNGCSSPGSRGNFDAENSLKEDYGDMYGADTKLEHNVRDASMKGSITNEPSSHQPAMAKHPEQEETCDKAEVPKRPPSLPHPQREGLSTEAVMSKLR